MSTHTAPQLAHIVGTNLRFARLALGMTQQQVADRVGAKSGSRDVSRWENGHVEPGPKYRQQLADLFFEGDVSALYRAEVAA